MALHRWETNVSEVYLTYNEVAERLKVSDKKIRELVLSGKLACMSLGYRTVRISESSLDAYMKSISSKGGK